MANSGLGKRTAETAGIYSVARPKVINVLIVGRSGTGKTTLIEQLFQPTIGTISKRGYSGMTVKPTSAATYEEEYSETNYNFDNYRATRTTVFKQEQQTDTDDQVLHTAVLERVGDPSKYLLNIFDTPGLVEHRTNVNWNQCGTDKLQATLTQNGIKYNVTKIHVICFVTRAGETNEDDVAVFKNMQAFLGNRYSNNALMILTHCEGKCQRIIDQYKSDLSSHCDSQESYKYCAMGCLPWGIVDCDSLSMVPETYKDSLIQMYLKQVTDMRNSIIEKFISAVGEPVALTELNQFRKQREDPNKRIHTGNIHTTCRTM